MLAAKEISVNYDGKSVLDGVSLELRAGEIIALLGPNGAGKTTLIRTLNGSVAIDSGSITEGGRELSLLSRRDVAKRIAVVAQENETKFPVSVLEFVLAGRFVHGGAFGWETKEDIAAAHEAIAECELDALADRPLNKLSGGERQRVVLARALATGAQVYLLDEPTANLDIAHQMMMFHLVRKRCQADNASAIVITHDLNLAAAFADQIMLLKAGKLYAIGTPQEVLTEVNVAAVFGVSVLLDANPASGGVRVTTLF